MNEENSERSYSEEIAPSETGANAAETTIHVNEYGASHDAATVIEEADRTVLLTKDSTIIFPKTEVMNIAPKNRPRKIYGGMWGPTEIATVGVSLLAILTVILSYVFLVLPAQSDLAKNRTERDRLEAELRTSKSKYGSITSTEQGVARLISSVDDFETRSLPVASNGRNALYQRINGLIGSYGLVNTNGPEYAPLDPLNGKSKSSVEESGSRAKFQSAFPGVYVTMTLEGSYQNLRRFIREIETSEQFVVISSVQLEPTETKEKNQDKTTANSVQTQNQFDQTNNQFNPTVSGQVPRNVNPIGANGGQFTAPQPEVQPQFPNQTKQPLKTPAAKIVRGKTHGETVSLHLEMAAYFRRPNFVPLVPETAAP